jgi:hypothetical protein
MLEILLIEKMEKRLNKQTRIVRTAQILVNVVDPLLVNTSIILVIM